MGEILGSEKLGRVARSASWRSPRSITRGSGRSSPAFRGRPSRAAALDDHQRRGRDADERSPDIYDNVLVSLDRKHGINNGEPALHAAWLAIVDPQPGDPSSMWARAAAITRRCWRSSSSRAVASMPSRCTKGLLLSGAQPRTLSGGPRPRGIGVRPPARAGRRRLCERGRVRTRSGMADRPDAGGLTYLPLAARLVMGAGHPRHAAPGRARRAPIMQVGFITCSGQGGAMSARSGRRASRRRARSDEGRAPAGRQRDRNLRQAVVLVG